MHKTIIALSAAASLLMLGAGAAQASVKPAATPACGDNCTDVSSLVLGHHEIVNAYVPGDTGSDGKVGQKVNLNYASNSHPNEDFVLADDGTVSAFCGTELAAGSVACTHYSADAVYELNWAPYGNETGLCAGTYGTIHSGENITLRTCGVYEGTLFIVDADHATGTYTPLIDGADASFSHPQVLTVNPGSSRPANQLTVTNENTLTGGVISDSQLFTTQPGPAA